MSAFSAGGRALIVSEESGKGLNLGMGVTLDFSVPPMSSVALGGYTAYNISGETAWVVIAPRIFVYDAMGNPHPSMIALIQESNLMALDGDAEAFLLEAKAEAGL